MWRAAWCELVAGVVLRTNESMCLGLDDKTFLRRGVVLGWFRFAHAVRMIELVYVY